MKVIVVDDELSALSSFLSQIISKTDIDYHFFKDDYPSIIEYVKNNRVEGAFLDINMPNINGLDLARELIKISPEIKICFITGLNVQAENIPDSIKDNLISIVYKPINLTHLEEALIKMERKSSILTVRMFNTFDCFINSQLVIFSSSKSKELFALLLVLNGQSLTMNQAITYLWPDKDIDKAKILYRDAVWRLRQTLKDINFECVTFQRALLILNKDNIECDYYNVLNKKESRHDNFLPSYDWSIEFEMALD